MNRFLLSLAAAALVAAGCAKDQPDCKGTATVCGGSCVELASDNRNCGACGQACEAGKVCSNGACELTCAAGLVDCGGSCIDPLSDREHCGATGTCTGADAGVACGSGFVCSAGQCALSCQTGLLDCGGSCIDPLTDRLHCGATGTCTGADAGVACGSGFVCSGGACTPSCAAGLTACGGACVDTSSDPANCGGCETGPGTHTCDPGTEACVSGACAPLAYVLPDTASVVRTNIRSALVDGTRGYVVDGSTFRVLDLTNPLAPVELGSVAHGFGDLRVEPQVVHGNVVWIARSSSGGYGVATYVSGIDVSNPAAPAVRGTLMLQPTTSLLSQTSVLYAGYWLVHDYSRNLVYAIDVRNPAAPVVYSQWSVPNMVNGGPAPMLVDGYYLYLPCRENGTFRIYDLSVLSAVVQTGQVSTGDASGPPAKIGSYVYIVDGAGLRTIDVSNPAAPAIVHTTSGVTGYLKARNGKLFSFDYSATSADPPTVRAYSLANPVAPAMEASSPVAYPAPTTYLNIAPMSYLGWWIGDVLVGYAWASPAQSTGLWALNFVVN